jgi:hypothetical protein
MTLSIGGSAVLEPNRAIYGPAVGWEKLEPTASRAKALGVPLRAHATFLGKAEFEAQGRRRRVVLMERMIADFDHMAADLDREIRVEQDRAGIHDPAHFAYPTYAKAAILRRDNLMRSADELRAQLAGAKETLGLAA